MKDKHGLLQKRRFGKKKPDLRFMKLSCWMIFLLGFESGGFQLALLKIAEEFNISNTEMGGLVSVQFTAMMIMPAIFGSLADKIGKKKILLLFSQIFTIGCLLTSVMTFYNGIVLGIFCIGAGYSVCESVLTASLFDEYQEKGTAYAGWTQCFFSIGAVSGPLICDYMMQCGVGNWRNVFVLMAVCYMINGILLWYIPIKEMKIVFPRQTSFGQSVKKYFNCVPNAIISCVVLMICYVGIETGIAYFLDSFLALELENSIHSSYVLAVFWLFMIPGRILSGKAIEKSRKILMICFLCILFLMIGWQKCENIIVFSLLIVGLGASCGMIWPLLMGMANAKGEGVSGGVSGFMTMGSGIGGALWPLIFGGLMDARGIRCSLGLLSFTGGIAIIILILQKKD